MNNTIPPLHTSEEVAHRVGDNIRSILAEQGRNLEWLAAEIGIDVQSILKQFSEKVQLWLALDASVYLNVPLERVLGDDRA